LHAKHIYYYCDSYCVVFNGFNGKFWK
jgi:hypothetical protein